MYQIYMLIGVVHITIGFLVSLYFIYYLVGHQFSTKDIIFSLLQALSTILIGVLYVYVSVLLLKDNSPSGFNYTDEIILNETNPLKQEDFYFEGTATSPEDATNFEVSLPEDDVQEDRAKAARFINDFGRTLIKMGLLYGHRQARGKHEVINSRTRCNSKENLYHQFAFLYSFMQGLAFLINSVFECKLNAVKICRKRDASEEDPDEQVDKDVGRSFQRNDFLLLLLSVFSLLLPISSSGCLFVMADFKPAHHSSVQNITQTLLESEQLNDNLLSVIKKPPNWKAVNSSEVNDIIDDIYKIVKHINSTVEVDLGGTTDYIFQLLNLRRRFNESEGCKLDTTALKIYTFVFVIAGYVAAVMYAKVTELKMQNHKPTTETSKLKLFNLKTNEIGFTTTWLPGILELIYRKYITPAAPTVFSHLLLMMGNLDHVISNLSRITMTRELVKSKNFIKPQV